MMTTLVNAFRLTILVAGILSLYACEGQSSPAAGVYDAASGDVSPNGDGKADEGNEGTDGALTSDDGGATEPPDTTDTTDASGPVDLGMFHCGDPPRLVTCQELAKDDVLCKKLDGSPYNRFRGTFEGSCTPAN